ncbi:hypothetical protein [Endozoicomonas atrinae]|uniref:hypothetical protein n=1 Tax=Endozoicomonas atrinae TaxID=1333660 RepID=UPI0008254230|nr:hypothetical protein [Endozoicomonas atrinae]
MNNAIIPETMSDHNSKAGHYADFKLLSNNTASVTVYYEETNEDDTDRWKSDDLVFEYTGDLMTALEHYFDAVLAHEPL